MPNDGEGGLEGLKLAGEGLLEDLVCLDLRHHVLDAVAHVLVHIVVPLLRPRQRLGREQRSKAVAKVDARCSVFYS